MPPMTILWGLSESWIAVPSLRNSGLEHKSNPSPHLFPDPVSRIRFTSPLVVPGMTVLLTRMRGLLLEPLMREATSAEAPLTWERSIEPSSTLGVPTATKIASAPWSARTPTEKSSRFVRWPLASRPSSLFS